MLCVVEQAPVKPAATGRAGLFSRSLPFQWPSARWPSARTLRFPFRPLSAALYSGAAFCALRRAVTTPRSQRWMPAATFSDRLKIQEPKVVFLARPHPNPLLRGEGTPCALFGFSSDGPANPAALYFQKDGQRFSLSSEERAGVRTSILQTNFSIFPFNPCGSVRV